jgi:hypothetical protein
MVFFLCVEREENQTSRVTAPCRCGTGRGNVPGRHGMTRTISRDAKREVEKKKSAKSD